MAFEKRIEIAKFDMNFKTMCVSIRKDMVIYEDGVEISRSSTRQAFCPGNIEGVKEYLGMQEGPEITYLEGMWTEEAIMAYHAMVEAENNA